MGQENNPEYNSRLEKSQHLQSLGINPYPSETDPSHTIHELIQKDHNDLPGVEEAKSRFEPSVKSCGRIVLFRDMGKTIFFHIQEETYRIQVLVIKDFCKLLDDNENEVEKSFEVIKKKFDSGDIVEVEGVMCKTIKGEVSIFAHNIRIIAKSLFPLPEKFHGLSDKETMYRKRFLDLLSNSDSFSTFKKRWKITKELRQFFYQEGFDEVETPILQSIYGGANARPFTTKMNALNQEFFLRISLEIPLKKLLIGGMPKVFELGKVFRNEGIDSSHNPEFTMLEAYSAYWDYNDMMLFTENLVKHLCKHAVGTSVFTVNDEKIDVSKPWKRMTMKQALVEYADINVDLINESQMIEILESNGYTPKSDNRGLLIAQLFDVFAQPKIVAPHHITHHPIETTPLCKPCLEKDGQDIVLQRFESFIFGEEICNAYSELNDPVLQESLLIKQSESKIEDPQPIDEDFIEAMKHGMPPAGGIGFGIDRLVMILTEKSQIKDVILFPTLKNN